MSNVFEHHGIKHLSASSLNLFRNERAKWVCSYLYGVKDKTNDAMQRGKDFEEALDLRLRGQPSDHKTTLVDMCLKELEPLGDLISSQDKVILDLPGILPVPIIGFLDFRFETCDVDCKTSTMMPKDIKYDHKWQGGIYHYGQGGREQKFLYAITTRSGKENCSLKTLDADLALYNQFIQAAKAVENFLSMSPSKEDLASVCVPNFDSFYWSDPETKKFARDLWRI